MTGTFSIHRPFAERVVARHDVLLLDYGPDEQTERVITAMGRVSAITTFAPVTGTTIDLAGFGAAPVVYVTEKDDYVLASDTSEALGWPLHKLHSWAQKQHDFAVTDQRRRDEERGDGRLGWELLLDYIDLGLSLVEDDPEARPDAGGRRWSHSGDWLISKGRLPLLLLSSPWGKEFMDNTLPAFSHAMREACGDKLKDIPTYGADGQPTGGNAHDDLFHTGGLTREEAIERARRGPVVDDEEGGQL
jgi:hypothetical protein